jgi:hypothetical protein
VHRELSVCNSEFAYLDDEDGIFVFSNSNGSSEVLIEECFFHDNLDEGFDLSNNGGVQKALVKDSVFKNLSGLDTFNFNGGSLKLKVDSCLFENTDDIVIDITDLNSSISEIVVENSVINSPGQDAVGTDILDTSGNSVQKICLINNTITADTFYDVSNDPRFQSGRTEVVIRDNFIRASKGIDIRARMPWTLLHIEAEHNCFEGNGFGQALSSDSGTAGAGNAIVRAYKNSFSGFVTDIQDFSPNTGVFYDVTKNWWGHAVPVVCTLGSCAFAQTCVNGFCQGPIVNGTSKVDASNPLTESIKCPHNCCKGLPTPSTTPPQATVTSAAERRMEKREQKLAKMKARQGQIELS